MSKFKNFTELEKYLEKVFKMIKKNHQNYRSTPVFPTNIRPGFLRELLPKSPPLNESSFDVLIDNTEKYILPNILKWQHPRNFGYFQSSISSPVILAEMIRASINPVGFQWVSSPASTELENIICDWTVQMLNLPEKFFLKNVGGGFISSTVSEAIFFKVQFAKYKKMKELGLPLCHPDTSKFVAYMSDYSFLVFPRAFFLKEIIHIRTIPSFITKNKTIRLNIDELQRQVEADKNQGLIPFFYGGSIGSTHANADDPVSELSSFCKENKIFLGIDAAYASMFFVNEKIRERYNLNDINSITINFSKAGLCGMGSAMLFIDDKSLYVEAITGKPKKDIILPEFVKNDFSNYEEVVDYSEWSLQWGRRFEALKIYWVIQRFGVNGLKEYIQHLLDISDYLVHKILENTNLEIMFEKSYALACFRVIKLRGVKLENINELNSLNTKIVNKIKMDGFLFLNNASQNGIIFIRFNVGSYETSKEDIDQSLEVLNQTINEVL